MTNPALTMTMSPETAHPGLPANAAHHAHIADRVEALCFLGLTASLTWLTVTDRYVTFTTPRTLPYLIIAIVLLAALTVCAWLGVFHTTPRSARRMLIALAIPALLISIPAQTGAASGGFDQYAGGRAIPIEYSTGERSLPGLDEANRTINIADDDFGSWFEVIDHDPQRYVGYTVKVTGFVSRPDTLGSAQFLVSRQLMSCCILDMTPFGFTATYQDKAKAQPEEREWVDIEGTLQMGTIGESGYSHQGLILKVSDMDETSAPTGYFYRP